MDRECLWDVNVLYAIIYVVILAMMLVSFPCLLCDAKIPKTIPTQIHLLYDEVSDYSMIIQLQ